MAQEIIGIKLGNNNKVYFFGPNNIQFNIGDGVICETVQGVEYGVVVIPNKMCEDKDSRPDLKQVMRKATIKDTKQHQENLSKHDDLMKVCKEKIAKTNLVMKLVDAAYTFDKKKITFYFTADGRVDFRELVKELASVYHTRIEMRQIFEKDDIKMHGALGPCGRPCCCSLFSADHEKISLKMAKNQGLSLNPTKLAGICGKLMCCLRYENETYVESLKVMPKEGSTVSTAYGNGVVLHNDLLNRKSDVRIEFPDDSVEIKTLTVDEMTFKKKEETQDNNPTAEDEE